MSLTLDELMQSLSYGELSGLAMANEGDGGIHSEDQPKIISALNETLQRLNNQFILERRDFYLILDPEITDYGLVEGQVIAMGNPDGYIDDTSGRPFTKAMQILSVRRTDGKSVPINDLARPGAITALPQLIRLQPKPFFSLGVTRLLVEYRPELTPFPMQPPDFEEEIHLPAVLHGALRAGIASHIFQNMNGQENMAAAQLHEGRYQARCQEVSLTDVLTTTEPSEANKFAERGWV